MLIPMKYPFSYITIVTIYTYIVYELSIYTIRFLLKSEYVVRFYIVRSLLEDIDTIVLTRRKIPISLINQSIEHPQNFLFQLEGGEQIEK